MCVPKCACGPQTLVQVDVLERERMRHSMEAALAAILRVVHMGDDGWRAASASTSGATDESSSGEEEEEDVEEVEGRWQASSG